MIAYESMLIPLWAPAGTLALAAWLLLIGNLAAQARQPADLVMVIDVASRKVVGQIPAERGLRGVTVREFKRRDDPLRVKAGGRRECPR